MRRHRGRSQEHHCPFDSWPWHFIATIACKTWFSAFRAGKECRCSETWEMLIEGPLYDAIALKTASLSVSKRAMGYGVISGFQALSAENFR